MYEKRARIKNTLTYLALGILSLFSVFPLYWVLLSSFRSPSNLLASNPSLLPQEIYWGFYQTVLEKTPFLRFFQNSVLVTLSATGISVMLAAMAAHSLARLQFRGKRFLSRGVLLAYIFPQIVLVVPLFVGIVRLNLANTYTGLILTYVTFSFPFATWMLTAFFQTIPRELEEAALIDGASNLGVFLRIALPLARPGLVAAAVFTFLHAWNEFLYALVILNSDAKKTLSVGLYGFIGGETMNWGEVLAASTMTVLPSLLFFLLVQRHLVHGLTAGAIKG